ncbi:Chromatin modification-related protein EAF3 [Wickerhamomyces ciferrii]|uniref:Chromatin modification-related protein EAF3 n=1 Tax=Wickerhamomyces ciferrii (strain ATCC 14091 / BCRC 22168 / CBS 111 / JCM 3599 / NBRC 0793 / NRRL Y-1031 F-60-10) TaxID=1206466 RepID=K0KI31_WICCF|nr:Chromatin modification-related protein EAF3 [Wickerhamomyces ciferrii]CCH40793.1 Chromatin modification-related protein EAF3 [Wickerhamomyces ciferrii]
MVKEEEQPYQLNGRCLAYHGPLLYEAKILKSHQAGSKDVFSKEKKEDRVEKASECEIPKELENELSYYIHYKGWKSSWDEWVGLRRLRPFNIENLKLQKELKNAALNSTSTVSASSGRKNDPTKNSSIASTRAGKRRGELDLDKEEDYLRRPEINILIPDPLKSLLVDDWEIVTKEHQLVELPAKPSVNDLLKLYRTSIGKKGGITEGEILDEFLAGLKVYFNRSLGNLLLYRFERQQFLNLTKDPEFNDRELSSIYGAEHLMRLMVTLPALIAQTTMDQQSVATLKDHVEDFLKFLDKNKKEFFLKRYENVSPHYEAEAKNA